MAPIFLLIFRDGRSYLFNLILLKAFTTAAVRLMEDKSAKFPQETGAPTEITEYFAVRTHDKAARRDEELSRHQGRNGRIVRTRWSQIFRNPWIKETIYVSCIGTSRKFRVAR